MPKAFGFEWTLRSREKLLSVEDYRKAAQQRLPKMVWSYVDEGADDLVALHDNTEAFQRWSLLPHVLTGLSGWGLSTKVAGVSIDLPILLGPTGFTGLSRWNGDVAAARAAARRGTRYVLSTASSWSVEEVTAASNVGHFFQLYPREGALTARLMDRAWSSGMRVLAVTVDVPARGNREGERRHGMGIPPTMTPVRLLDAMRHPRWSWDVVVHQRIAGRNYVDRGSITAASESAEIQEREFMQGGLNWDDLAWIRDRWKGFMYIKGVMRPEEAVRAVDVGVDGVIVSNHGGRQLGAAPGSLDALPPIVQAVGGRAEVLLDGGVRRGSDVVKALALGARAVLIGRPYVYGLAVGGEGGVVHVLDILKAELTQTLAILGVGSVGELNETHLLRRSIC